jgi:ATP-dependent Lhr-like helicase
LADGLVTLSAAEGVPNEFFPHHGSLAKGLREELEERLKDGRLPTTAVATTTLELGIDIGSVSSVAQIGPPASIAGLRQRVGRSGRREGQPSQLRIYVIEPDEPDDNDLFTRLRCDVVQSVAAVRLLLQRWIEPGHNQVIGLSSLLHQILAFIRERGGARAKTIYDTLCGPGPFASVTASDFATLLKAMGATTPALIEQASDGVLMLGALGEQMTDRYDFYAVFMTDEEYRIVTEHRALGSIPIFNPLRIDDYLTFAGRRWIVEAVDDKGKVIRVAAAPAGNVPKFPSQEGAPLHDRLVAEMRAVFRTDERPVFLDAEAWTLLQEGRTSYAALDLDRRHIVGDGDDAYLFHWQGTRTAETLRLALASQGIRTEHDTIGLRAPNTSAASIAEAVESLSQSLPTATQLAAQVETLRRQKYDHLIPDELLRDAFARSRVSTAHLKAVLDMLASSKTAAETKL